MTIANTTYESDTARRQNAPALKAAPDCCRSSLLTPHRVVDDIQDDAFLLRG